jgi:hypothetical protein
MMQALAIAREFRAQAVLTSPYGFFWLAAARVAREMAIPLHLIVHDDWASTVTSNRGGCVGIVKRWFARRVMRPVYRQAASRLCVSPNMVEKYQMWFGARGDVLYPSRGDDSPAPRIRVRSAPCGPPVVAYCGLIHQAGTVDSLCQLAAVLATMNGRLDYYGPHTADVLAANWGLTAPVVRAIGFLPAAELGERVGSTAHVLFLPASFRRRERDDVSTLFPSKLADYTAIGLPVLVWGPNYSSAVRWAADNPGATVCVTDRNPTALIAPLKGLLDGPATAVSVAAAGVEAGNQYFDLTSARETFINAITSSTSDQ